MSRKKEKKKKIPGALVKKISKKKKKKRKKVAVPKVVDHAEVVIQDITNFGDAGGILRTMVTQMVVGGKSVLGEDSSAVVVDQILNPSLSPPLSFKVMRINWKRQTAIVDGKKMTIKEAKRRGFINKDGSTTTKQGQLVVSCF